MPFTKQFLRKATLVFTFVFFVSIFLPVFAYESETQTETILTDSGVLVEPEDTNLIGSTGGIILNQNLEQNNDLSSTGNEIEQESKETGSGEILDEEEKITVSTGSDLLQTEDKTTETGSITEIAEKEVKKDEKQVKVEKEVEF